MVGGTCHTITGSGDTVGAMLCLSTGDGGFQVRDHHATHPTHGIQSDTPTHATVASGLTPTPLGDGLIPIARANVTDGSAPPTLTLAEPEFIGTGIATGQAGDGVGHWRVSVGLRGFYQRGETPHPKVGVAAGVQVSEYTAAIVAEGTPQ